MYNDYSLRSGDHNMWGDFPFPKHNMNRFPE
jgi:hypothetical protein